MEIKHVFLEPDYDDDYDIPRYEVLLDVDNNVYYDYLVEDAFQIRRNSRGKLNRVSAFSYNAFGEDEANAIHNFLSWLRKMDEYVQKTYYTEED